MQRVRATSLKPMAGMEVAALTLIFTIMFVQLFLGLCMEHSAHHGVSVDVPRTLHPKSMERAQRKDALVVAILRSGAIFLGGDMISPDNLGHKLHDRLWSNGGERKASEHEESPLRR